MLATLTEDRYSDENWIFERKLDGVRAIVCSDVDRVELFSRNHKPMNASYPELVDALARQTLEAFVGDGEIVAFDGRQTSFARLQSRIHQTRPDQIQRSGVTVYLYLFDVLVVGDKDVTRLPQRGPQTVSGFGALLVGYYEGDKLRFAGKVGTGFDQRTLNELRSTLDTLTRPDSPFADKVAERRPPWVRPELVAQVGFTEWTADGKLRHPRYVGLRTDKSARKVVRESR